MALHYLAMKNHWCAIDDIARAGGQLDHVDHSGKTPLAYAVQYNRLEAIRALLLANCSPHNLIVAADEVAENSDRRWDPLEMALRARNYSVARWLLLAGSTTGPLIMHLPILEQHPPDEPGVEDWMMAWACQPHTLRHLSRVAIRAILRTRQGRSKTTFDKLVDGLTGIPAAFADFIRLRELTDEHVNWSVTLV